MASLGCIRSRLDERGEVVAPTIEHVASARRASAQDAVAVAYVSSMFMGARDNHIVNVALPTLSREFHASIASVQWTVTASMLSLAI